MDTLTFFQRVLPQEQGVTYLVLFPKDKPYKIHRAYTDLADMAAAAAAFNVDPTISAVYHACASYKEAYISVERDGVTKRKYRVDQNWHRAKAFWIDVDCGQDKADKGEGYATKKEAATAVLKFSAAIGWPAPMIVDSGGGLHGYWALDRAIKAGAWLPVARALKAATAHFGLLADPTATADFARILRPARTTNRKLDNHPRLVNVKTDGVDSDPAVLAKSLLEYVKANNVRQQAPAPLPAAPGINDDLTAHLAVVNIPSYGDLVADGCAQARHMRDSGGDVPYEVWRGVIGVLRHCEDGAQLAQTWSARRAETGHTNTDWQTRFETWSSGPATCEFFEGAAPERCNGCPHKGKIKSPIMLGRKIEQTEETEQEVVTETATVTVSIPALPRGYTWDGQVLARMLADKDGLITAHAFSHHLFYPTMRIKSDDGTFRIGMRMHLHDNRIREFQISFEAMASSTDLLKSLARYELMQTNHKDAGSHMTAYLRDSLEELKRRVAETNTFTSFGWKEDMRGFLLGDRYYKTDGTIHKVLLAGYAASKAAAFPEPTGTVDGYASAINHVYNRSGMECMQYALCSGWGSLLIEHTEELYCGLLVALVGGDSGKGKSTVTYASLYAFGDANAMALKSDEAGTRNALWATVGTFNNVPLVFDELTKVDAEDFSKFAYTMSLGEEKARLQATGQGVKFASQARWRMSAFVTANKDLHGVLASVQANSQAEAVRLIQIHVDRYPIPQLEETEVQSALAQMKRHRGAAGEALVKYCVTHVTECAERVRDKLSQLVPHIPGTKYRFYRNHAACTLVMAEIANEIGVCAFDVERLKLFTIDLMRDLAQDIAIGNTVRSDDAFSRIVADLMESVIVTSEYRDGRSILGAETPRRVIRGSTVGRYVVGNVNEQQFAGFLFLSRRAVKDWCVRNRTDYNNVVDFLKSTGALVADGSQVTLTRGTELPRVQTDCLTVDTRKLDSAHLSVVDAVTPDYNAGTSG